MSKKQTQNQPKSPAVEETAKQPEAIQPQKDLEESNSAEAQSETTDADEEVQSPASESNSEEQPALQSAVELAMNNPLERNTLELIREQFEGYVAKMRPGNPIANEEVGAANQVVLWRIITSVLRMRGPEFGAAMTLLLALINEQTHDRGVFSATHRYRFFAALKLGANEARSFESILHLLIMVANPKTRTLMLGQVDLGRVFKTFPDKTVQDRITDYFHS